MSIRQRRNGGLIIVAGHAIYQSKKWYGGFPGEDRYYESHVLDGLKIARSRGYEAICFSGGRTRDRDPNFPRHVTNSEAEGMIEFAQDMGCIGSSPPHVLAECYARDSFENVFFSMLCFYYHFSVWPSRVGVVSWKFKAVRFYLIACGLKLGDGKFIFYGSGDPHLLKTAEIVAAANAHYDSVMIQLANGRPEIFDPLHRDPQEFGSKRLGRIPNGCENNEDYLIRVKQAYDRDYVSPGARQGVVGQCIDMVEELNPGPEWREKNWPWND